MQGLRLQGRPTYDPRKLIDNILCFVHNKESILNGVESGIMLDVHDLIGLVTYENTLIMISVRDDILRTRALVRDFCLKTTRSGMVR